MQAGATDKIELVTVSRTEVIVETVQDKGVFNSAWNPRLSGHLSPEEFAEIIVRMNRLRLDQFRKVFLILIPSLSALFFLGLIYALITGKIVLAVSCAVLFVVMLAALLFTRKVLVKAQCDALDREAVLLSTQYSSRAIAFRNVHDASGQSSLIITLPN
jgi:hypothetical protein